MTNEKKQRENWYWDVYMQMSSEEKREWNEKKLMESSQTVQKQKEDMDAVDDLEAILFSSKEKFESELVTIRDDTDQCKVRTVLDGDLEWKMAYLRRMSHDKEEDRDESKMMLIVIDICLHLCTIPNEKNEPWDKQRAWEAMHKRYGTQGLMDMLLDILLIPARNKIADAEKFRVESQRKGFRSVKSKARNAPPPTPPAIPST